MGRAGRVSGLAEVGQGKTENARKAPGRSDNRRQGQSDKQHHDQRGSAQGIGQNRAAAAGHHVFQFLGHLVSPSRLAFVATLFSCCSHFVKNFVRTKANKTGLEELTN
jgi:hypothetical protein